MRWGYTEVDVQEKVQGLERQEGWKLIMAKERYILREHLRLENSTYRSLRFVRAGREVKEMWLIGGGKGSEEVK